MSTRRIYIVEERQERSGDTDTLVFGTLARAKHYLHKEGFTGGPTAWEIQGDGPLSLGPGVTATIYSRTVH